MQKIKFTSYPDSPKLQIFLDYKLEKQKKRIILQGIRLWHCINICHTGQNFSLPRQIKPVEEGTFTNLWGK